MFSMPLFLLCKQSKIIIDTIVALHNFIRESAIQDIYTIVAGTAGQ
jgi:hypothetical protein